MGDNHMGYDAVGPEFKRLTLAEADADEEVLAKLQDFLKAGHFIGVYENQDLGHPELGHKKFWAGGNGFTVPSPDRFPKCLPDTQTEINWRYWLQGVVLPEAAAVPGA